jgi:hypothetical protein
LRRSIRYGENFSAFAAQQALFAFVDSLAKVLLTCIPEPPQAVREPAIAQAKERHNRLLKGNRPVKTVFKG